MASKNLLTEQDKIAYSVISKFIKENGYPPSVRELCKIMGKSSTATIKYRLKSLEQKGFIKTTSGAKRTIRLLNEVEQGRCDWCKTGEQKCGTCRRFFDYYGDGGSDKCSSECDSGKCAYYQPIGFCPNCGADMRGDGNA